MGHYNVTIIIPTNLIEITLTTGIGAVTSGEKADIVRTTNGAGGILAG